jgi:hypothetical protein
VIVREPRPCRDEQHAEATTRAPAFVSRHPRVAAEKRQVLRYENLSSLNVDRMQHSAPSVRSSLS